MIRNWGIRNRVLLLALLPIISLGLVLGSYFIRSRVHDLKSSQSALGHVLANQLASASEYGVLTNNPRILQTLAQAVAHERNVESVTIADSNGRILSQVIHPASQEKGVISDIARRIGADTGFKGELVFTHPITLQPALTGEFGELLENQIKNIHLPASAPRLLGNVIVKLSEVSSAERQAQVIVNSGLIVLACLALAILLALAISGSVAAPIGRIIAMVKRFSSGDDAIRVPERSGGEIGQLEHGINHMAANAQRSQQELREQVHQATAELRETLEKMEIKNVELDLARKRALEASRAKSEFLANMSHEIRTPMNAVLGFSDLLTKTPLNEGQRNYLATIRQSARALLVLLDDVLNAARLETTGSDIQMHSFVLRDLLEEIVQITAMEAYAKQLELILHIQDGNVWPLLGDRIKLTRILSNLVMNAIKFTDAGSVIISSHSAPRGPSQVQVDIRIIDTGIGIRAQDQQRLFEPFFQIDSSAGRQHGGAGLGLYIAKKLLEQMDGSLTLVSASGRGSEFHLSLAFLIDEAALVLPLAATEYTDERKPLLVYEPQPQAADALLSRLKRLGWRTHFVNNLPQLREALQMENVRDTYTATLLSLGYDDMREPVSLGTLLTEPAMGIPIMALVNSVNAEVQADISRRVAGPCLPKSLGEAAFADQIDRLLNGAATHILADEHADASTLQGLSLMVADDNRINRLLARVLLEKYGARVLEAETGQQVIELAATHPIDLILLDMHMPGEDGWQVARRLKTGPHAHSVIPIIALSAMPNEESLETLTRLGLADWLIKPLDEGKLLETVLKQVHPIMMSIQHQATHAAPHIWMDLDTAIANLRPPIRQMLLEDLPLQRRAIETTWQVQDFPRLKAHVHKLNGSAAFCRLGALHDLCIQVEASLRNKKHAELPHLLPRLILEVQDTLEKLVGPDIRSAADP